MCVCVCGKWFRSSTLQYPNVGVHSILILYAIWETTSELGNTTSLPCNYDSGRTLEPFTQFRAFLGHLVVVFLVLHCTCRVNKRNLNVLWLSMIPTCTGCDDRMLESHAHNLWLCSHRQVNHILCLCEELLLGIMEARFGRVAFTSSLKR